MLGPLRGRSLHPQPLDPMLPTHFNKVLVTTFVTTLAACAPQGSSASQSTTSLPSPVLAPTDAQQAKVDLGRMLMFDGGLSRPRGIACGTCHDPLIGWGDARPQGKGVQDHTLTGDTNGDGKDDHDTNLAVEGAYFKTILTDRNTPTIYNAHIFPNNFWDGRAGDLGHQALFPIEGFNEMNASWDDHVLPQLNANPEYVALFEAAYGAGPITAVNAANAIGEYEKTISVFDTPYDLHLAGVPGALSADALAGLELFRGKANCASCHSEPLLSNFGFENTGVPNSGPMLLHGQLDFGRGKRLDLTVEPPVEIDDPADYMKFKVAQLRMVALTGPYMHNGVFDTLEEVVEFYDQGGGPDLSGTGTKAPLAPLGLTAQEKAQLVTFLREGLTGTPIE